MSAIAFFCTKENIIIHSDGRAGKDGELYSMSQRKAYRINDNVGMLWMGVACKMAPWVISNINSNVSITEIAREVGKKIKQGLTINAFDTDSLDTHHRYMVIIIGYNNNRKPKLYQLDSKYPNIRYSPKETPFEVGQTGCQTYNQDATKAPYDRLLKTKHLPIYQDPEYASTMAFKEMVKDIEAKGGPVGGKIFTELLRPPATQQQTISQS